MGTTTAAERNSRKLALGYLWKEWVHKSRGLMTEETGSSRSAYGFDLSTAHLIHIIFIGSMSLLLSVVLTVTLSLAGLVRRFSQAAPICIVQAGSDNFIVLISSLQYSHLISTHFPPTPFSKGDDVVSPNCPCPTSIPRNRTSVPYGQNYRRSVFIHPIFPENASGNGHPKGSGTIGNRPEVGSPWNFLRHDWPRDSTLWFSVAEQFHATSRLTSACALFTPHISELFAIE